MILLSKEENPFVAERKYFNDKYGNGEGDSLYNRDINAFNKGAKAQLKKVAEHIRDLPTDGHDKWYFYHQSLAKDLLKGVE